MSVTRSIGGGFCSLLTILGISSIPYTTHAAGDSSQQSGNLQEVVVTAQKREERLQDVPIPVSVVDTDSLVQSNQLNLTDYYTQVPGFAVTPGIQASNLLSIRGITTGATTAFGNQTVGVVIDDVPFAPRTAMVPDLDPGDLTRIEVLRGPQGTLYGANSIGGLLKFVTADPSTAGISGRVEAGTSTVYNGAELGYSFRGSVNLPVSDTIAVRASAFTRSDPGYIDNPILHLDGVNQERASGGHFAFLWRPSDAFSLRLSALYQGIKADSTSDVTTHDFVTQQLLGDLQQSYVAGLAPYDRRVQAYSAIIKANVWGIDITSLTGYNISDVRTSLDETANFGALNQALFGATCSGATCATGAPDYEHFETNNFSEELRFSGHISRNLDIMVGGFYQQITSGPNSGAPGTGTPSETILSTDPITSAVRGTLLSDYLGGGAALTRAVFGNFTYHFSDQFNIQLGGREESTHIGQQYATYTGPFAELIFQTSPFVINQPFGPIPNAFTYLVTPQFKISQDLMVYARVATGYQTGAANPPLPGVPREIQPATTHNYEIGTKGSFLDNRLSIDSSVYYIDWQDIQLNLVGSECHCNFGGNAGSAKSEGVEFSLEARPVDGLTLSAWVAYDNAVLTAYSADAVAAGTYAAPGDRLPYSSRFSGNLSVNDEFPVTGEVRGFVNGTLAYTGDRLGLFTAPAAGGGPGPRQAYPAYTRTDLSAGLRYSAWTGTFYVNNLFDRRGLVSGGLGNLVPYSFYYVQPRTIGLNIVYHF